MSHQTEEHPVKDLVCGMKLSRMSAVEEATYQGKTDYFCAQTCRKAFDAQPQKYVHHHCHRGMKPE